MKFKVLWETLISTPCLRVRFFQLPNEVCHLLLPETKTLSWNTGHWTVCLAGQKQANTLAPAPLTSFSTMDHEFSMHFYHWLLGMTLEHSYYLQLCRWGNQGPEVKLQRIRWGRTGFSTWVKKNQVANKNMTVTLETPRFKSGPYAAVVWPSLQNGGTNSTTSPSCKLYCPVQSI